MHETSLNQKINNSNLSKVDESLSNHLFKIKENLDLLSSQDIIELAYAINSTRRTNSHIYVFGNGGSAATALHMANDLSRIFDSQQKPLKINCLNSNMSTFSAIANDFGYENVFTHQLKGILNSNDILIGFSASGNSANCVEAFSLAKQCNARTIGILGFDGGQMKQLSDFALHIKDDSYFIVENLHMCISHALTFALNKIKDDD